MEFYRGRAGETDRYGKKNSNKEELQRDMWTIHADKLLHMLTELAIAVFLYRQIWKQKATKTCIHIHMYIKFVANCN